MRILNFGKKSRKYPIKKDIYGVSARKRAFKAFDSGKKPAEVAPRVGISRGTARRYFADWKKLPGNWEYRYYLAKRIQKQSGLSQEVVALLSHHLGMSEEEVTDRLQRPWAIKQLLIGQWPNYRQRESYGKQEARLRAALELVLFMESSNMSPEDTRKLIGTLISKDV